MHDSRHIFFPKNESCYGMSCFFLKQHLPILHTVCVCHRRQYIDSYSIDERLCQSESSQGNTSMIKYSMLQVT